MKKVFTLLLALTVVLGLTLAAVACGDEETATSDDVTVDSVVETTEATTVDTAVETTENPIPADAVFWRDAETVEDEVATVYGEVKEVTNGFVDAQIPLFLVRVGSTEAERDYFNIKISTDDEGVPNVPGVTVEMMDSWVGKTVLITGTVTFNQYEPQPTWEIVITDASDVVVVE